MVTATRSPVHGDGDGDGHNEDTCGHPTFPAKCGRLLRVVHGTNPNCGRTSAVAKRRWSLPPTHCAASPTRSQYRSSRSWAWCSATSRRAATHRNPGHRNRLSGFAGPRREPRSPRVLLPLDPRIPTITHRRPAPRAADEVNPRDPETTLIKRLGPVVGAVSYVVW